MAKIYESKYDDEYQTKQKDGLGFKELKSKKIESDTTQSKKSQTATGATNEK